MTRATSVAAFTLSAAMIVLGQQTAIAHRDKVEAGSCAIANSGNASGNAATSQRTGIFQYAAERSLSEGERHLQWTSEVAL
jgi:hypothetical protein